MPPSPSPAKRPSLLAWIGFAIIVALTVWFLSVLFSRSAYYRPMMQRLGTNSTAGSGVAFFATRENGAVTQAIPPMMGSADILIEKDARGMMPYPTPGGSAATDLDGNSIQPRVIKNGNLTLRVADAPASVNAVRDIVTKANGFVESSSLSDSGSGPRSAWITVRIPVAAFESTLTELKGIATLVLNESIQGQDVTSEFVDLEADLRNTKAEEASYLEVLKRSGDVQDILDVTQRLAEVRGRIERLEGRKRYLENRTDYATLSITVTEETRIEAPTRTWKPGSVFRETINDLVIALQELVNFLIRAGLAILGLLLPIALITGVVIWIGWRIVKAILRRLGKK